MTFNIYITSDMNCKIKKHYIWHHMPGIQKLRFKKNKSTKEVQNLRLSS